MENLGFLVSLKMITRVQNAEEAVVESQYINVKYEEFQKHYL